MVSNSATLKTSADHLIEIVMKKEKITIEEAAKLLKMPENSVRALVDFLVEEKIIGIEYKFTTPYIYLSKKDFKEFAFGRKKETEALPSKEEFYNKAKSRNIPYQEIEALWIRYLEQKAGNVKEEFYEKAKQKNISDNEINGLWQKYLSYL